MSQKPIVIYHSKCIDGFTGAWCFWSIFGDSMEYHPGVYSHSPPDIRDRDVYLVDFSYRRDVVQHMLKHATSVTLLDHHVSALQDLEGLEGLDFANSGTFESGAKIAWDFVKSRTEHERPIPQMLLHVQDRDLWNFKLDNTRELNEYMFSQEYDFKAWSEMMDMDEGARKVAIGYGNILRVRHMKEVSEFLTQLRRPMLIAGYEVEVACMPYTMASDAGNIMSLTQPFAATYYDTKDHRCFSLRSNKSNPNAVDVSVIASTFESGGGHKHASGFKVPRTHPLARC